MLSGLSAFCESLNFCDKVGMKREIALEQLLLESAGSSPFLQGRKNHFLGKTQEQL